MEIWKDIIGYEGYYQVSNMGNVKSLERIVINRGQRKKGEMILSLNRNRQGYLSAQLWKDSKCKLIKVHRLVAQAFLPNPNNYPLVMHLDNNPANNILSNLKWGNQSQNILQCVADGRYNNQYTIK